MAKTKNGGKRKPGAYASPSRGESWLRQQRAAEQVRGRLTEDQFAALERYAKRHGRPWREYLRHAWEIGETRIGVREDDDALLRQVRNAIGPSGLAKVRI